MADFDPLQVEVTLVEESLEKHSTEGIPLDQPYPGDISAAPVHPAAAAPAAPALAVAPKVKLLTRIMGMFKPKKKKASDVIKPAAAPVAAAETETPVAAETAEKPAEPAAETTEKPATTDATAAKDSTDATATSSAPKTDDTKKE